jgi:hypothetical protein
MDDRTESRRRIVDDTEFHRTSEIKTNEMKKMGDSPISGILKAQREICDWIAVLIDEANAEIA